MEEKKLNIDMKIKINEYLRTLRHTTPEERGKLRAWIKSAGTAYGNPWELNAENGSSMDYISALRLVNAMQTEPDEFFCHDPEPEFGDDDRDLPF